MRAVGHGKWRHRRLTKPLAAGVIGVVYLLIAALLVACGTIDGRQPQPTDYAYALRAFVVAGEEPEEIEERFDGEVVVWRGEAGFAVLGLDELPEVLDPGTVAELNRAAVATPESAALAGGYSVWSGGYTVWSGGDSSASPYQRNDALWGHIGLHEARALAPRSGGGVVVAVIDTGLDLNHPAFAGRLTPTSTWRDFVSGDSMPAEVRLPGEQNEGYGHGTAVAGIVLQVAPEATIMPLRVLGPDGSGSLIDVAAAVDWAVAHGADVINMSLGALDDSDVLEAITEYATERGVIVVASAGNAGVDELTYPAGFDEDMIVGVGSVDAQDSKSTFSNYGDDMELVAPGEVIYTVAPEGMMAHWTGTSMSAALVSGALALGLAEAEGLTLEEIEDVVNDLLETLVDIEDLEGNEGFDDDDLGGRLDVRAFLAAIQQRLAQ